MDPAEAGAVFQLLQLPQSSEALVRGVLFGDTAQLDEEVYDAFRQNGTAHVLAVSGLHIGILYGLFQKLQERRRSRLLLVLFLLSLAVYGTAACWSVSVRRAVLLIVLAQAGQMTERRCDLLTALSAAALAVMAVNPFVIFGASFQMSFLAVASMAFFTPALERVCGRGPAAVLAVQLGLMPYMAYTFNYISFSGLAGQFSRGLSGFPAGSGRHGGVSGFNGDGRQSAAASPAPSRPGVHGHKGQWIFLLGRLAFLRRGQPASVAAGFAVRTGFFLRVRVLLHLRAARGMEADRVGRRFDRRRDVGGRCCRRQPL